MGVGEIRSGSVGSGVLGVRGRVFIREFRTGRT